MSISKGVCFSLDGSDLHYSMALNLLSTDEVMVTVLYNFISHDIKLL